MAHISAQSWFNARVASVVAALAICVAIRSDTIRPISPRMLHLPRLTLWAWERPEDLRGIDPATAAVAYLDETIFLTPDGSVSSRPRMQPVAFPARASRIAVVRIEAPPGEILSAEVRQKMLELLLLSARQPDIGAFQVDFDATRSQRDFYRVLLVDLRREMPANLPLSMTALASWCSWDDWIRDLPVDEAVPMFFRMEPDRRRGVEGRREYRVREPLCLGSVGVSTREPWPADEVAGKRIYLFPDRGWRQDAPLLAAETRLSRLP